MTTGWDPWSYREQSGMTAQGSANLVGYSGMALEADVHANSSGQASMRFTAGGTGPTATDLYKKLLPGFDDS